MTNEERDAKLQEINNRHFQKIAANWNVQQSVQFSLKELNLLHNAVVTECDRYFKTFHQEDESRRALMHKIDKIMEDIEIQLRD